MSKKQNETALQKYILKIIKQHEPDTARQLVNLLRREDNQLSEQQIVAQILKLQAQGEIAFTQPPTPPPKNLTRYLQTTEAYWYWITVSASTLTTIITFAVPENLYPLVYIRYILGSIFVMLLPGYSLLKALFPEKNLNRKSERGLDSIERTALSIGLSLALVPMIGLILNYTPWGIRLAPIVTSLLTLTLIFATTAVIREYQSKLETRTRKKETVDA